MSTDIQRLAELGLRHDTTRIRDILSTHDIGTASIEFQKDLDLVLPLLRLKTEIEQALCAFCDRHRNDRKLWEDAVLVRWLVVEFAHPSEWLVDKPPTPNDPVEPGLFQVITLVLIAAHQIRKIRHAGIDDTHIHFNLGHLRNYINNHFDATGEVGTSNYTWNLYLAAIGLIHLHTLHFMHHVYTDKNIVLRHKRSGEIVMIALDGIDVRKDGQFNGVNDIEDLWFTTTFKESEKIISGHRVNPYGAITNEVISLSKTDYDVILRQGDATIDYHIPTGPGYNLDDVKWSFSEAVEFFRRVYPEYDYKAFWCLSWLSSPQLPLFLSKQTGNIYKINQQSYSFPAINNQESILEFVFHDKHKDLSQVQPKTSLEEDIIRFNQSGRRINCGIFLYFLDDLDRFGLEPYRNEADRLEFLRLNGFE